MWNKGTLRCSPQVLPHLIMTPHVFPVMKWAVRLTSRAVIADRRRLWKQSCSSDQNKPPSICPVLICEGSESPVWQRYVMSTGCIPDDEVWTHQLRKNSTMNFFSFRSCSVREAADLVPEFRTDTLWLMNSSCPLYPRFSWLCLLSSARLWAAWAAGSGSPVIHLCVVDLTV